MKCFKMESEIMKTIILLITAAVTVQAATVQLVSAGPANDGAYYVLPYNLSVDGVHYDAACYDFYGTEAVGQTWQADVLTLDQAQSSGRFSSVAGSAQKYQDVALLMSLYPGANQVELQHLIWSVFAPGAFPYLSSTMVALRQQADELRVGFDYSGYRFVEGTGVQPFVINIVPEPSTGWIFLGLGLVLYSRADCGKDE